MDLEILADELMGQGDPRGELMTLQLQPSTPRLARTIRGLVTKHRKELLGPLEHVLEAPEFEHGFLVSARLRRQPTELPELLEDPGWSTLRTLDLSRCDLVWLVGRPGTSRRPAVPGHLAEFLNSRPALREVRGLSYCSFPEAPCPHIEAAEVHLIEPERVGQMFPALRELVVDTVNGDWHAQLPHLERLIIGSRQYPMLEWTPHTFRLAHDSRSTPIALVKCVEHGHPVTRLEIPENYFCHRHMSTELHEILSAVRRRGVQVVLTPSPAESIRVWRDEIHW